MNQKQKNGAQSKHCRCYGSKQGNEGKVHQGNPCIFEQTAYRGRAQEKESEPT